MSSLTAVIAQIEESGKVTLEIQGGQIIHLWLTQLPEGAKVGDFLRVDLTLEREQPLVVKSAA